MLYKNFEEILVLPTIEIYIMYLYTHTWFKQVYALSKLLTEEAAFKFANENGVDLVSVITTTVAGPFLTATLPSSIQVLLSPVTAGY